MLSRFSTVLILLSLCLPLSAELLVHPYLQDLTDTKAVLAWVSHESSPVEVSYLGRSVFSLVTPAAALEFHPVELDEFPQLNKTRRYLHRVTLEGIEHKQSIQYTVHFADEPYRNRFRTLPGHDSPVRLIAYGDSETEPESTGKPAKWGTEQEPERLYLIDQTTGYKANLAQIALRQPNAILIAGDLVESGGEQRDWDEFWRHKKRLAGAIPFLTAPGNHEYYAGPKHGGYQTPDSRKAIAKYRTYFPPRYYSRDLGRATVISLDSVDGLPPDSSTDSNHHLLAAGDFAPGFHPESEQVKWLERELARAQKAGRFILVMFHHCPYSCGVHGFEPGNGKDMDPQSGQALRTLTPLFMKYGVDVLVTGHDEMMERSQVSGTEVTPEGVKRPTVLQIYDVGIGGDGLRGPRRENSFQEFLAYKDSPEVWENGVLLSGGRHYGHLEIDVTPAGSGWRAVLKPVYILPVREPSGWKFERKLYPDELTLP